MGLATLRMALLPTEAPPERREMVLMAGRASYMMATRNTAAAEKAFQALVARYPETPNVHYAYAVFLLQEQPDKAIDEFKRELELQPEHAWSLMQIAYEYVNRGDAQAALPWATAGRGRGAEVVRGAQGARAGAARHRRRRGGDPGTRDRHRARAGQSGSALHAGEGLPARRAVWRMPTRERAEFTRLDRLARTERTRRAVCGRQMTALRLPLGIAFLTLLVDACRISPATASSRRRRAPAR